MGALELPVYVFLWYAFNAGFNVQNKLLLNDFNFAWVVSWVELASGLLFVVPLWVTGARSPPKVDGALLRKYAPICLLHAGGHLLQVSAMGAGGVYFTHLIKASEPLVGMAVVFVMTGKTAEWYVGATLLVIVGGVGYAATKPSASGLDLSELWSYAAVAATGSTVAFAVAKVLAKQLMSPELKARHNLDAANNYAVLTCCSTAVLLVPSLVHEGGGALAAFGALGSGAAQTRMARDAVLCGLLYYAYNEVRGWVGPVHK